MVRGGFKLNFRSRWNSKFRRSIHKIIFAVPGHVLGELEVLAGAPSGDRRLTVDRQGPQSAEDLILTFNPMGACILLTN